MDTQGAPDPSAPLIEPLPTPHPDARRRAMRSIAVFEGVKGLAALAAGIGFVGLLHRDMHRMVATLIGHIGLDPGARYPALLLQGIDALRNTHVLTVVLACLAYAAIRLAEGWALWHEATWGQWLGTLSGLLYVPFELAHFVHRPTWMSAVVIAANLAIVAFLGNQLWAGRRRRLTMQE